MDNQLYEQEWRKRAPRLDVLNILVPKTARVEHQRLHWTGDNRGKLRVHVCPQTHQMGFGLLPRAYKYARSSRPFADFWNALEGKKVPKPRPIATLCGICLVPLRKATYNARGSD